MLATLTSKGQFTLPKEIRERLGLTPGSRLDFSIDEKGMLVARPVTTTALGLARSFAKAGRKPVSVAAMNEAVEKTAAEMNPRKKR